MIEHKTIIDQIEITRIKTIQIRFGLLLVDGDTELSCQWHRTVIEPGVAVDDQIKAVNQHLQKMGRQACALSELTVLKTVVTTIHTPTVIAEYQAMRAAQALEELRSRTPPLPLN